MPLITDLLPSRFVRTRIQTSLCCAPYCASSHCFIAYLDGEEDEQQIQNSHREEKEGNLSAGDLDGPSAGHLFRRNVRGKGKSVLSMRI